MEGEPTGGPEIGDDAARERGEGARDAPLAVLATPRMWVWVARAQGKGGVRTCGWTCYVAVVMLKMVLDLPVPRSVRSRELVHDFLIGPDFDDQEDRYRRPDFDEQEDRHRRRSVQRSLVQPGGESSAPLYCGTVTTEV